MKEVYRHHLVFVVIAKDVGIVSFDGRDPLFLLQLLDGRDQVATFRGPFELLGIGRFGHARAEGLYEVSLSSFEKKLHIAHCFGVGLGSR